MKRLSALFLILAVLLGACVPEVAGPLITAVPTEYLATSIALTVQAQTTPGTPTLTPDALGATATNANTPTASPSPTSSIGEAIASPTPTRTPQSTPSPTPTAAPDVPAAEVEITAPGALSKVISPIPIRALLVPGANGRVTVELIGEDERVITRQIVILNPDLGRKAGLVIDLPFEIPNEAELARLAIYRQDEFGRTTALSSIDLVLLSSGQPDYNTVVDRLSAVVVQDPLPDALIQGGNLVISGLARPTSDLALVAELITETGQIVGQRVFTVVGPDPSQHVPFIVEVPFNVDEPTWVLLIIRERGERIPGTIFLTSMEVLLSP